MGALIPLAISFAPQLARWLFGPSAGETAKAVENAAVAVLGSADPAAISEAMKDPDKAAQFRIQLAQIAADKEKAERASELEELKQYMLDANSARQQQETLATAKSPLAWVPAVLSAVILGIFLISLIVIFTGAKPVNDGFQQLLYVLLGTLAAMVTQVGNFWLGSSKGSVDKQQDLKTAMAGLAQSVPTSVLPSMISAGTGTGGGAATRPF
jgi:hypothetical protein